nr:tetrahydromethanopterin S-methyltransferase subunit A [Candidatus Njordarchaeum guaymaensis]
MGSAVGISKVKPPADYPPEEGRYIRGNDYSSVAVAAILDTFDSSIPVEVNEILKVAIDGGAALAGSVQTENIGIEKIITNIVANPNIRYLIICGREVEGHRAGDALKALIKEGVNGSRAIRGTRAPKPYLFNISMDAVERFRKQVVVVDLMGVDDSSIVKQAVWTCYQEKPTAFQGYKLHDVGAYPAPTICRKIRWRITRFDLIDEDEMQLLVDEMKRSQRKDKHK